MKEHFKIHITDLPIGLICYPLMLVYLSVLDLWVALACLIASAIPLLVRTYIRGFKETCKISLWTLSLKILVLLLGTKFFLRGGEHVGLSHCLLWIIGFLLTRMLFSFLVRKKQFPLLFTSTCCCDRHRNNMILAEYRRFERILYRISLYSVAISTPLVVLFPLSRECEIGIVGFIVLLSMGAILFEILHLSWLRRRLSQENWVQIFDEQNNVIGRVTYTDIANYEKEGVFPLVRLLVISQGMVYLERTCLCNNPEQKYYDSPFVDWLNEGSTPEAVSQRMLETFFDQAKSVQPRRLTPYKISIKGREYLVYLLVVQIKDPSQLYINCKPQDAKWWGIQLLKDSIGQGGFSPHIANELPLIEQTIMLAQKLSKRHKSK